MLNENHSNFFKQHGHTIQPHLIARHSSIPFLEHPQFQHLIDVLSRKASNHTLLEASFSQTFYLHFINALSLHLTHDHVPSYLRHADVIYLDLNKLPISAFKNATSHAHDHDKLQIIA